MVDQAGTGIISCWHAFLERLDQELGKETVDKWVRSLVVRQGINQKLYVEVKDSFQALWFEEHLRPRLQTFTDPVGTPIKVIVETSGKKAPPKVQPPKTQTPETALHFPELDPFCTFEHFISQVDNEIVVRLLKELCTHVTSERFKKLSPLVSAQENPLKTPPPNPIYICGPTGSGKTHLLTATAHRLRQAGLNVVMARSELFTEHVVRSIRSGEMSAFRKLWRTADVMILDDVHLFSRKITTQEELFHTFNTLHVAGKHILLAANCFPQQLQFIEPRLVSRFEWGVVLPLSSLPRKSFPSLLEKKSSILSFLLPQRIISALSDLFHSSPKACTQALEALMLRWRMAKNRALGPSATMTVGAMQDMLSDLIERETELALTPEKIIQATAESFGIKREDLLGRSQNREYVGPRQIAMYLIRKHLKLPFIKIGDVFEKNHSTVMSSIRQVEKLIPDPQSDAGSRISSIEIHLF
jgi:chromosomal replication initiator protein